MAIEIWRSVFEDLYPEYDQVIHDDFAKQIVVGKRLRYNVSE